MVSRIISASALLGRGTKAESSSATANKPKGPSAMKKSERRVRLCVIFGKSFNSSCLSISRLDQVIRWHCTRLARNDVAVEVFHSTYLSHHSTYSVPVPSSANCGWRSRRSKQLEPRRWLQH